MMIFYKNIIDKYFKYKYIIDEGVHVLKVPSRDSLVIFLFIGKGNRPVLLLKSPRNPLSTEKIVREASNLNIIVKLLKNSDLKDMIPHLFEVASDGINKYLVFNVIEGELMAHVLNCSVDVAFQDEKLLSDAVDWLIQYHQKVLQKQIDVNEYIESYLLPLREKQNVRFTENLDKVWKAAVAELKIYKERHVPISLCHGDFNPYNVLLKGGKISGVIDWADVNENVPIIDFLNFFSVLICGLPHRDYTKLVERFKEFNRKEEFEVVRKNYEKLQNRFMDSLDISEELLNGIYLLHLINMALKWDKGTVPHAKWEEISLYYMNFLGNSSQR